MNTHADKTRKESKSEVNELAQKQHKSMSTFQLVDNRPETITQRKWQEKAHNSPQVRQLSAIQEKINNGNQTKQSAPLQKKENNTGLPNPLKTGIEQLSGYSMDDVKVHYNSEKPAQLNAHAYAQGTDIHLTSGQERHLAHEAWHVVQQMQGRVRPTFQMDGGVKVNDNVLFEKEADTMGRQALQMKSPEVSGTLLKQPPLDHGVPQMKVIQLAAKARIRTRGSGPRGERIISELVVVGRMPTTTDVRGQGAHLMAEALIVESVRLAVVGKTRLEGVNALWQLALQTIPRNINAGRHNEFNLASLDRELDLVRSMIRENAEGEDQNEAMENAIETYVRLANKRDHTVLSHHDPRVGTIGGVEWSGISQLNNIQELIEGFGDRILTPNDIGRVFLELGQAIAKMVDFLPQTQNDLIILSKILARAIDHTIDLFGNYIGMNYEHTPKPIVRGYLARLNQHPQRQRIPALDTAIDLVDRYQSFVEATILGELIPPDSERDAQIEADRGTSSMDTSE